MAEQKGGQKDMRLAALRRFATAITVLNVFGHTVLGFEQSWAQPLVSLLAAYSTEILLEVLESRRLGRKPRLASHRPPVAAATAAWPAVGRRVGRRRNCTAASAIRKLRRPLRPLRPAADHAKSAVRQPRRVVATVAMRGQTVPVARRQVRQAPVSAPAGLADPESNSAA